MNFEMEYLYVRVFSIAKSSVPRTQSVRVELRERCNGNFKFDCRFRVIFQGRLGCPVQFLVCFLLQWTILYIYVIKYRPSNSSPDCCYEASILLSKHCDDRTNNTNGSISMPLSFVAQSWKTGPLSCQACAHLLLPKFQYD